MSAPKQSLGTALILVIVLGIANAETNVRPGEDDFSVHLKKSGTVAKRRGNDSVQTAPPLVTSTHEVLCLEKCPDRKTSHPLTQSLLEKFRQKLRHISHGDETKNKSRKLAVIGNAARSAEQTYFFREDSSVPHEKRLGRSSGTGSDSETSGKMSPSGPSSPGSDEIAQVDDQNLLNAARKINLAPVSFANHYHQSFSARSTEARFHKIDSSHFSSQGRFRSNAAEPSFNLPPLFSGAPTPHRPSRFPPPYAAPSAPPVPEFDSSTPTNISAQHGSNIFLQCTIKNLSNQSVSWIRSRDSHIISVDQVTFIADERFHVFHDPDSGSWSLQIKYVQARDDGTYECQVSSEPKISHFVHFTVVTPMVRIPGGPDIHVQLGDTVTLKCVISAALHHPNYVFWYQGDRVVADPGFGSVRADTSHRTVSEERISSDTTVATLLIPRASAADAGTYTCAPDALPTASISLHVINGEHPAAMQHGTSVTSHQGSRMLVLAVLALLWAATGGLLAIDQRKKSSARSTIAGTRISLRDNTDVDGGRGCVMTRRRVQAPGEIFEAEERDLCGSDLKQVTGKATSVSLGENENDAPCISEFLSLKKSSKAASCFLTNREKYHFRNQSSMSVTRLKYSSKSSLNFELSSVNANRPSGGRHFVNGSW